MWQFNKSNHNPFFYVFLCLRSVWVSTTFLNEGSEHFIDSECVISHLLSYDYWNIISSLLLCPASYAPAGTICSVTGGKTMSSMWVKALMHIVYIYELLRLFIVELLFFLSCSFQKGSVWHSHQALRDCAVLHILGGRQGLLSVKEQESFIIHLNTKWFVLNCLPS